MIFQKYVPELKIFKGGCTDTVAVLAIVSNTVGIISLQKSITCFE
jgi:hypothetical protein